MLKSAEVYLWGTKMATVSLREGDPIASFSYSDEAHDLGIAISPITMPLDRRIYRFPELPMGSFHGLPGLLSDSLPDKFGNKVIAAWMLREGKSQTDFNCLDRLSYAGKRGMGALEYRPALFDKEDVDEQVSVSELSQLAAEVLKSREEARAELVPGMNKYSSILKVGSSAGGARAKALIGWNEGTGEVRSGQVKLPTEFGYWLIKFDGLEGNGDKEGDDKWGYGRVEYAYYLMAKAAGINMNECRLWNRRHFMTRRFDRTLTGDKLHMQTLGGMAHYDFNDPVSYSYEQAFEIVRRIVPDARAGEEFFRRMVFNVLAWNCDDHVKNVSFLMDRNGEWTLSPAYDECYAYNPVGAWTSNHQMSVNGKRIGITDEDMIAAGKSANLSALKAKKVIARVREAVAEWERFAAEAEVKDEFTVKISNRLKA